MSFSDSPRTGGKGKGKGAKKAKAIEDGQEAPAPVSKPATKGQLRTAAKVRKQLENHSKAYKGWLATFESAQDSYPRDVVQKCTLRLAQLQTQEAALALLESDEWKGDAEAILAEASEAAQDVAAHAQGVKALVDAVSNF